MDGDLEQRLRAQRERSAAKRTPEMNATIVAAIEGLRASGISERAPGAGDRAPGFTLPNVRGAEIGLGDLLARGPVVLAFYRGVW